MKKKQSFEVIVKENVTYEEVVQAIKDYDEEITVESELNLINALANYKVYLLATNKIQLVTKNLELDDDFFDNNFIGNYIYPVIYEEGYLIQFYITKEAAEDVIKLNNRENDIVAVSISFKGIVKEIVLELPQFKGFNIDPDLSGTILYEDFIRNFLVYMYNLKQMEKAE